MNINRQKKEIHLKIVYYGPAYSGKTTNLEKLHEGLNPNIRSDLTSMKNDGDRTLFFDYMQVGLGKIGGLTPRFNLYTVPGQVQYGTTRKIVLRGSDAVVFVADSSARRAKENVYSWRQLHQQLKELNFNPAQFPVIMQFNKRDLPDAMPIDLMKRIFNLGNRSFIEAQAHQNIGTRETLQATIQAVFKSLRKPA